MRLFRNVVSRWRSPRRPPGSVRANDASVAPGERRVLRVFVSSTFRDMRAERDELVKWTFPELRRLCERRGVTWADVDLRWGVPSEEAAESDILAACIAEIDRCRPYFIGLLGERYGWVPRGLPAELVQREPWLAAHAGASITELEMLHGALNAPAAARAFFYFRDPAFASTLPPQDRLDYCEGPTQAELAAFGEAGAALRANGRRRKLTALKQRIRAEHRAGRLRDAPREGYRDARALGRLVYDDLRRLVEDLFPDRPPADPLAGERAAHATFAATRREVYVAREATFDRLDAHANGDGPPLTVLGDSGAGKTALLANWAERYRARHPDVLVLQHFIGASRSSADWREIVRRLIAELNRAFDLHVGIPDEPQALCASFADVLYRASAKGRVLIVIDALNQLENREGARELTWFPAQPPAGVRFLLSTVEGPPVEALRRRDWPTMIAPRLKPAERRALIALYVREKHGGRLGAGQIERLVRSPQAASPLFLRTVLDELRAFGAREGLDERIDDCLAAQSVAALYAVVLARWETDYERDRPGLVGDALQLLWAARRGLAEHELLELLGDGAPLPQAHWAPLHLAAWDALVARSGRLGFFHDALREAVETRYVSDASARLEARLRLLDYFDERRYEPRAADELAWQLAQCEAWAVLSRVLGDPKFFDVIWELNAFEVKSYWAAIERNTSLRMVDAYHAMIDAPEQFDVYAVGSVARLLLEAGHLEEASRLRTHLVSVFRGRSGEERNLVASIGGLAQIRTALGDFDGASRLNDEEEQLCRALDAPDLLARCLRSKALIFDTLGDLDAAMALHREAAVLERSLQGGSHIASSLTNQALILWRQGDSDSALALLAEADHASEQLGDVEAVQRNRANRAGIFSDRGRFEEAAALLDQAARAFADVGDLRGSTVTLRSLSAVRVNLGDLDGALALLERSEDAGRRLGDPAELALTLSNRAALLRRLDRADEAMALLDEGERLARESGAPLALASCLANRATLLENRGDLDEALALLDEEERLRRTMGHLAGLAACLGRKATALCLRGDLDAGMALLKQQEELVRKLDAPSDLAGCLGNQALVHEQLGGFEEAMALLKAQEALARRLASPELLAKSLANQARVLRHDPERLADAVALVDEALRIAKDHGLARVARYAESVRDALQ